MMPVVQAAKATKLESSMGATVITITSGKGGVGKTTATANIGICLAKLSKRVVVIDADIGLRNLDVVMGLENRVVYDLVDVVEGRARVQQALIRDKRVDSLFLLPAAQTRDKDAVHPEQMVDLCNRLRPNFDFILIDSPAGIERGYRNAVAPADKVIIIATPEVSSVRDADRVIGLLEAEGKGAPALIINRINPDLVNRGEMLTTQDMLDILAIELLGVVPEDEAIIIGTNRGYPITLDSNSPSGKAFCNVARRLIGEKVPFIEIKSGQGFFKKLARLFG